MRKIITTSILTVLASSSLFAQNVGIGTSVPSSSAKLEISSTNSGLLIPRVALISTSATNPVTAPAISLMVYNTASVSDVSPGYYFWTGVEWSRLLNSTSADWTLMGNAGTDAATNFIGTTDAVDFVTRTNNIERMRVTSTGNVGLGINAPSKKLHLYTASGYIENRVQSGTTFVDFGVNSAIGSYVFSYGAIPLYFGTNGVERMRILATGNVGIGTTTPAYRLDLANGTFAFGNSNARTETRDNAGLQGNAGAQSGFFETSAPVNYPTGASSWWHLIDSRHSNNGNNYAMQIAGSFFDQELWFRKTNGSATQAWTKILTSTNGWSTTGNAGTVAATNFIGTTDAVDFVTRTSNIERLRVTSAGNVGVGTAAPGVLLDVNGTVRALDVFAAGGQNLIVGDDTYFSDLDAAHRLGLISTSNVNIGELKLGNSATNPVLSGNAGYLSIDREIRLQNNANVVKRASSPNMWADQFDTGTFGVYTGNSEIEEGGFWANGNYAMILSPGDNDLVKIVDEDYLDNLGSAYDNNAMRARIDGNGQYFQISDARSKTNIQPIQNSLEKLLSINGYTYQFTLLDSEKAKGQQPITTTGVLAQELEKVLPEAVSNYEGNYMVNYAAMTPLLIEAIQEQQTMIENQQKLIDEQMKMLQELKKEVESFKQK